MGPLVLLAYLYRLVQQAKGKDKQLSWRSSLQRRTFKVCPSLLLPPKSVRSSQMDFSSRSARKQLGLDPFHSLAAWAELCSSNFHFSQPLRESSKAPEMHICSWSDPEVCEQREIARWSLGRRGGIYRNWHPPTPPPLQAEAHSIHATDKVTTCSKSGAKTY